MYQLLNYAKSNTQTYFLSGTVGTESFGENNVIAGTFTITNQCCNSSEFNLGNVTIGKLTATFTGLNIARNAWEGKYIVPFVTVDEVEIPLGRFKIDEATHNSGFTTVVAYDDMAKFDKAASCAPGQSDTPYNWLKLACKECGVTLGMTQADVEALPNGSLTHKMFEQGDIETWRDVLYWTAVKLCSFCTMDRQGKLVLRTFHSTVDDTFPASARYVSSTYGDEIVTYTGINVNVTDEEVVKYYSATPDNGYTYNIGTNPFMQGPEAMRAIYAANILSGLANIGYNACKVAIPFGAHYDLGDVLQFPNGSGSSTNKFCLMGYTWTYCGQYVMTGIPQNKKSLSKTDKDVQGLINNTSKNETTSYEAHNLDEITIGDNEEKLLIHARITSNKNTKAMIHIEVNLESVSNTPTAEYQVDEDGIIHLEDIWNDIGATATKGIVSYIVNAEEDELHPEESWIDGNHVLHLMYILPVSQNVASEFYAYMKSEGGTITIDEGGVWFYALGVGLVGDAKWNGSIEIEEVAAEFQLVKLTFDGVSELVDVDLKTPTGITVSDSAAEFTLLGLTIESATDTCTITTHTYSMPRITEDSNRRITEDGDGIRYTEGD